MDIGVIIILSMLGVLFLVLIGVVMWVWIEAHRYHMKMDKQENEYRERVVRKVQIDRALDLIEEECKKGD